jgi:isoleucyl-tRNA synthetase
MPEDKGLSRSQREEKVLQFWKTNKTFEKSLAKDAPRGDFVFFEGPPTANGKPGIHHLESRSFKDAMPRYKTMQGFRVPRKAGWDTHGLPVELQIEKKLGFKSKKDIEAYGVEKFNEECKKSVWEYVSEWRNFSDRIGYWLDFDHPYITYENNYISSVWSILKHVEERKLLYKDYKVLPWCPRCGTALSSHELAQGYQDVKDLSLYVKFKLSDESFLRVLGKNPQTAQKTSAAYLLAWTTTPWTLPGNIALAVGEKIEYVKIKVGEEIFILAESRLTIIKEAYELIEKIKGSDLVGLSYEPLYPFAREVALESEKAKFDKAFKVYAADFVTTEDGTGIVHTAVMYGQEDFDLGTKVGLPKVHLVLPDGTFIKGTGWLEGRSVVDLPADSVAGETLAVDILKDLKERGLLFDKENHLHSYPFCWRCKTRLIYYARDSWYIRMSALRNDLIEENKKINWEPEYIKEGRFGEWLREVKDWAISRERYWGTPLPVWQNADGSKRIIIGSIDELKEKTKKSGNKYFVMRHGGTEANAKEIVSFSKQESDHLTEEGKVQARTSAKALKKIDVIIASPFVRTKETAEIVAETIGLPVSNIIFDKRLAEVNPGEFDGKDWSEYHRYMYETGSDWFSRQIPGGEALQDVGRRVGATLYELEEKYKDKNILIITHGGPAWLAYVTAGLFEPDHKAYQPADSHVFVNDFKRFDNAEVRELSFVPLPHNENFIVDLHKPFIDEIKLEQDGEEYTRVKEVMDVWFDSGAVPFAQDPSNVLYPADFISEAIDQTRGWFYTLHAIGTLMEKGLAFRNVICLGHLLDKEGKKMSKSVGNVIEPWEMFEKYGVDVLRFWMYSINQPGEAKNFDERTVDEVQKKVFNLLDNVHAFYELYRDKENESNDAPSSKNVLDVWILTRLAELVEEMTEHMDAYQLLEPTRALREFMDDLSTWYLRRSRDRLKDGDKESKQTLYFVLKTIAKLLAPFSPFVAEELYQRLRLETDVESVHLEAWPTSLGVSQKDVLIHMQEVRKIVSLGLEARSKANIKIRQPLQKLTVKMFDLPNEYLELIKDEINVKEVVEDTNLAEEVSLDTTLTPQLVEEGQVREIIRSIQEMRKEKNLMPKDVMKYEAAENAELLKKYKEQVEKTTNIEIVF